MLYEKRHQFYFKRIKLHSTNLISVIFPLLWRNLARWAIYSNLCFKGMILNEESNEEYNSCWF